MTGRQTSDWFRTTPDGLPERQDTFLGVGNNVLRGQVRHPFVTVILTLFSSELETFDDG
ncbi:MAG: hypothetical protein ACI87E_002596 [Mariniblastus sp.]|jgi:hypothetical protein